MHIWVPLAIILSWYASVLMDHPEYPDVNESCISKYRYSIFAVMYL